MSNNTKMKLSKSRHKIEGNFIYWILDSNYIEFTLEEFQDLVSHIKRVGLFTYLEKERIALKHQLLNIVYNSIETDFWAELDPKISKEKYIESFLEQCILNIDSKIKR